MNPIFQITSHFQSTLTLRLNTYFATKQIDNKWQKSITRFAGFFAVLLSLEGAVWGQVAFRGYAQSTATISASTTLTIDKPTGVIAGDIMIAHISQSNTTTAAVAATLSGWTSMSIWNYVPFYRRK